MLCELGRCLEHFLTYFTFLWRTTAFVSSEARSISIGNATNFAQKLPFSSMTDSMLHKFGISIKFFLTEVTLIVGAFGSSVLCLSVSHGREPVGENLVAEHTIIHLLFAFTFVCIKSFFRSKPVATSFASKL